MCTCSSARQELAFFSLFFLLGSLAKETVLGHGVGHPWHWKHGAKHGNGEGAQRAYRDQPLHRRVLHLRTDRQDTLATTLTEGTVSLVLVLGLW